MKPINLFSIILSLFVFTTNAQAEPSAYDKEMLYRVQASGAKDVAQLIPHIKNLNIVDESGWPILTIAAARTDDQALEIVKALVQAGVDINFGGPNKQFALVSAIQSENSHIVAYLLEQKADYNVKTEGDLKASDIAFQSGQTDIARLFQDTVQKDRETHIDERGQANLNRLSYNLAYHACAMQYYGYYYNSQQDTIPQETQNSTIQIHKQETSHAMTDLARLFRLNPEFSTVIFMESRQSVFSELEKLVSNRYRREVGVGSESDMNKRCTGIAAPYGENYLDKGMLVTQ